jgi:hypothetical protein
MTSFTALPSHVQEGWSTFEACLFVINAVLPSIVQSDDAAGHCFVMEIMELYLGLKCTNSFIVKTTLRTIGEGGA